MKIIYPDSGFVFVPHDYSDYPDCVDVASYRPDGEAVRAFKTLGTSDGSTLQYDYPDGVVPEDDAVSDVVLSLRSGKLDKAEVQTLMDSVSASAVSESDKIHADKVSAAVDKVLDVGNTTNK